MIGRWASRTRTTVLATVPSLVEHPDDQISSIGKRHGRGANRYRVARDWIGPELDPLDLFP